MARTPSEFAELFVHELNARHGDDKVTYSVQPGNKMDKIVRSYLDSYGAHAFVEKSTGHVYKAAGWAKPAAGVRYTDVFAAAEASDRFGSYLYK